MKKSLFLLVVSLLFIGTIHAQQNHWNPEPTSTGNVPLVVWAKVYIDGQLQTSPDIEVAMFFDGVPRKTERVKSAYGGAVHCVQLGTTYDSSDPAHLVTFKCYDHNAEKEYDECPFTYTTTGENMVFNIDADIHLEFTMYFKKVINAYSDNGGYYFIASPIGQVSPEEVTNMLSNCYDLYYFDNGRELEWINYKDDDSYFDLEPGKGYLYANSGDVDAQPNPGIELVFHGTAYTGSGEVTLKQSLSNPYMSDWNLVGNPFGEKAYLADGRDFYIMNLDGTLIVDATSNSIEPMEGVFVKAEYDEETITFTTTEPVSNGRGLVLNLSKGGPSTLRQAQGSGTAVIDRAVVRFGEGRTLPKFQIKEKCTQVYIPMDGTDYAVVRSEEMGEVPVSFKAEEDGSYTLSFSALNTEFGYLHLIDNMTGNDVDLLANSVPELVEGPNMVTGASTGSATYTFTAKTTDNANRFKLVFVAGASAGSETFAFYSNGSWVINNEGQATLQVVDLTGRLLSSELINGSCSKSLRAAAGVYMLRLVSGDDVKVQKIVVK